MSPRSGLKGGSMLESRQAYPPGHFSRPEPPPPPTPAQRAQEDAAAKNRRDGLETWCRQRHPQMFVGQT